MFGEQLSCLTLISMTNIFLHDHKSDQKSFHRHENWRKITPQTAGLVENNLQLWTLTENAIHRRWTLTKNSIQGLRTLTENSIHRLWTLTEN